MTFMAMAAQKSALTLQKSFVELQMISAENQINIASAGMSEIQGNSESNSNYSNDPTYLYYEQMEEEYEGLKDMLENQRDMLNEQINSLKSAITNSIKESCKLNLSSGG